jgi:hypothetical protein
MTRTAASSWLTRKKLGNYILPLILFYLLISSFGPTLKLPLLSDDYIWVRDVAVFNEFSDFVTSTFALKETDFRYRPLMPTGIRLCYQISRVDPFCMHLASFSFHFLNTILVGNLAYLLTKNWWSAWAATFFFAVYFPHVVTVVWPSDSGNLLATFFMVTTATFFLLFTTRHSYFWWAISLVTFALAMISKESALALGPILVTWGAILFWKEADTFKPKLIAVACGSYILLTVGYLLAINRTGLNFAFSGTGNYAYHFDLIALRNTLYYPLNFIRPTQASSLEIAYQNLFDISQTHMGGIKELLKKILTIPSVLWLVGGTLVIWLGALWLVWRRQTTTWLALVWIICGILPVIFIAGYGERHSYVASVGLSLLVGDLFLGGMSSYRSKGMSLKTFTLTSILAIGLALNIYWTQIRVQNWQIAGNIADQIISTVMTRYPNLSADSELWFVGLPTDYNDAHLFRLGIDAAFQLELNDSRLAVYHLSDINQLPETLAANQYAFIFTNNQLVDLTPDYRPN